MAYQRMWDPKDGPTKLKKWMDQLPQYLGEADAECRAHEWQRVAEAALRVAHGEAFCLSELDPDEIAMDEWRAALPQDALVITVDYDDTIFVRMNGTLSLCGDGNGLDQEIRDYLAELGRVPTEERVFEWEFETLYALCGLPPGTDFMLKMRFG